MLIGTFDIIFNLFEYLLFFCNNDADADDDDDDDVDDNDVGTVVAIVFALPVTEFNVDDDNEDVVIDEDEEEFLLVIFTLILFDFEENDGIIAAGVPFCVVVEALVLSNQDTCLATMTPGRHCFRDVTPVIRTI